LLNNKNRVSNSLLGNNKIEKKKRKKLIFKKISNIKKLRKYKRLLTLTLKEEFKLYNAKIEESIISKKIQRVDQLRNLKERLTTTKEITISKSRNLSNFNYIRIRLSKFVTQKKKIT